MSQIPQDLRKLTYSQIKYWKDSVDILSKKAEQEQFQHLEKIEKLKTEIEDLKNKIFRQSNFIADQQVDYEAAQFLIDNYRAIWTSHPELNVQNLGDIPTDYFEAHRFCDEIQLETACLEDYELTLKEKESTLLHMKLQSPLPLTLKLQQQRPQIKLLYQTWKAQEKIYQSLRERQKILKESDKCQDYLLDSMDLDEYGDRDALNHLILKYHPEPKKVQEIFQIIYNPRILNKRTQFQGKAEYVIAAAYLAYLVEEDLYKLIDSMGEYLNLENGDHRYGIDKDAALQNEMRFPDEIAANPSVCEDSDYCASQCIIPEWLDNKWKTNESEHEGDGSVNYFLAPFAFVSRDANYCEQCVRDSDTFYRECWKFGNRFGFRIQSRVDFYSQHTP